MRQLSRRILSAALASALIVTIATAQATQSAGATALPSEAEIRKILGDRVNALAGPEDGIGIVVGL